MDTQTYYNLNPAYSNYVPISRKYDIEGSFENLCIIFSLIGPFLVLLYFFLSSHIFIHFNSISDSTSREIFILLYRLELVGLAKLLFAGSVFSGIGVLLSGIHENMVIFSFSLFCFLLSVGFYLPTIIMYTGG